MAAVRSKALESLRRLNAVAAASVPSGASFCSLYSAVACPMSTMATGAAAVKQGGMPQGTPAAGGAPAQDDLKTMPDEEIVKLLSAGVFPHHKLESLLGDATRAVHIRRKHLEVTLSASELGDAAAASVAGMPVDRFNEDVFYQSIEGTNCENVIGYIPYPVGVIGPLTLDGKDVHVPMATTEGALLASANRGARAISLAGGATTNLHDDGMTRAPLIKMPTTAAAAELRAWVEQPENFATLEAAFNSTTRFGKLRSVTCTVAGRNVFVRFRCFTGDAMGMNMITKG
ncbi:HMG2, partial [Symbiodinium sp. KB8]